MNPVRLPSVEAKMTNPEYPMMSRNPINTVGESRRSWNQCDKGVQTPSHWDKREKPSSVALSREVMTTPTEVCRDRGKEERSNRYQKTVVAAVEMDANGTKEGKDQLMKSEGHRTATHAVQMNCSRVTEPMSGPVRPVVPKIAVVNDTDTMHYEWIVRESVRTTETLTTNNYLEVPVLQLPRRFLHLAVEARTVDITKDKLCCFSNVQPQWIGLPKPVRVTVLRDSPVTNGELNDRVDLGGGVSSNITEQPLFLALNIDESETAPMDRGDSDADSGEHSEPVDRLGPVDPLSLSEQPASPGLPMDGTGDDPMYREDSTTLSAGWDEPVDRLCPGNSQCVSGRPVVIGLAPNDEGRISTGPVDGGLNVANQRKRADRPTRMMPNNDNEQLVFLGVEVERGTDAPDLTPVPDDVMIRDRASSDGWAEPDEIHRPVDTTRTHAENDVNGSMILFIH